MHSDGIEWAGVRFIAVDSHDAHFFKAPGLYGFARREAYGGRTLLYLGCADVIAVDASPGGALWADALGLGMQELHLALIPDRLDRLQLADRIVRRVQPLLNLMDEAQPFSAQARIEALGGPAGAVQAGRSRR